MTQVQPEFFRFAPLLFPPRKPLEACISCKCPGIEFISVSVLQFFQSELEGGNEPNASDEEAP